MNARHVRTRKLEICIESLSSVRAALAGGADRLEVCGRLAVGGITPSAELVEQCVELSSSGSTGSTNSNTMMMIRPHWRDFVYSQEDLNVMLNDICIAKQMGVQGVVFGALTADRSVDKELCRRLIDTARPLEITFHRAFDLAREAFHALDDLLDLGFDRVLTSGQAETALQGSQLLQRLVHHAGETLSVIVAGNVRAENIRQLQSTGATEFHSSARTLKSIDQLGSMDSCEHLYEVDEAEVRTMAQVIHRAG